MEKVPSSLLLALSMVLIWLSSFPPAFAGRVHVALTRQAHEQYLRQRQLSDRERKLTDVVDRGSEPPLHMFESKASFEEERREEGQQGGKLDDLLATPIKYHGGPVLSGETLNIYLIYYGYWPAKIGQNVIENFIQSLSLNGSDAQGGAGDPKVKLAKVVYDQGSQGKKFDYNTPWKVVMSKIGDGKPFPYDADGIYMVLTGNNVDNSGFCKKFCGWHTMNRLGGSKPVAYALVGHHGLCPEKCGAKPSSPNGKPWLDAMVSTVAHEIAEAATDPDSSSGWMDSKREENADKCSYNYGVTLTVQNEKGEDAEYNLVGLNNMKFLVQQNWDVTTGACVPQTTS
ncbi:unnamed protein product [Closterium sp. NIES-65]|nr:unnamed protein product [Closterium sp. NIES-65]